MDKLAQLVEPFAWGRVLSAERTWVRIAVVLDQEAVSPGFAKDRALSRWASVHQPPGVTYDSRML